MKPVYIRNIAGFLPGDPVANKDTERILGQVGQRPSRARRVVLRSNGIRTRHYAIDPDTGRQTHTNAGMTAAAVREVLGEETGLPDLLSCGTSTPDQLMPNHAVMVHGELGRDCCEAASFSGICVAGMSALRHAAVMIGSGQADSAVATGSELVSNFMRAGMFAEHDEPHVDALGDRPELAFQRDFLRWMLSDGAGAMLLGAEPESGRLSLRLDWIEQRSFAHEQPVCMYAGANVDADGRLRGWREYGSAVAAAQADAFAIKQDVRLLNERVVDVTFGQGLAEVRRRHRIEAQSIDWFVPHYSSAYFRPHLARAMAAAGFSIPEQRWFSNLAEIGNVGSASIYLHLAAMLTGGRLAPGQRIFCFVPESGRFSSAFMHLTVVDEN